MDFFDILLAKKLEDDRDPTIEGLSVTENGTYSEEGKAYNPVVVNVPEPTLITKTITANGTYTASDDNADGYSSVTVAVEGFKKKSIANTPTDIASFDDGTANPMTKLGVGIEPQQDLHGYDHPWAGGDEKNKLPINAESKAVGGITFTVINENGTPVAVKAVGTAAEIVFFNLNNICPDIVSGSQYILTSGVTGDGWDKYAVQMCDVNTAATLCTTTDGTVTANTVEGASYFARIIVWSGQTVDLTFKPMLRLATETDATFEPYSNICPISGWSGAQITVTDDLTTPTTTHTTSIPFHDNSDNPITVYGGRLNVTTGELTVDMVSIDLSSISAFSSDAVNANGFIRYNCVVSGKASNFNLLCSMLKVLSTVVSSNTNTEEISGSSTNNRFYFSINADRLSGDLSTTAGRNSALKDWLISNDIQVVYELETPPQTYQLTPTQVTTLLGQNNIFADCGQILEGEYFVTL